MMEGSSAMQYDSEFTSTNDAITLILVGKLGYGKSATGNTILGQKAFESKNSMTGVTNTAQIESTVLRGGRTINVIDSPGLFDWSVGSDEIGKEIVKCVNLAKDGVHAVIIVFSIRARFSEGEETTLERLKMFFGDRIVNYMILVFTGGDDLNEDETFTEYLSKAPTPVQNIIQMCKNRVVLFDNKTHDKAKIDAQVQQLMLYVDSVIEDNEGKPFSDEIFQELKKGAVELHNKQKDIADLEGMYTEQQLAALKKEMDKSYNDQLASITKMVEQKLNNLIEGLEKELKEERTARMEAQKTAADVQSTADFEIRELNKNLYKAEKETDDLKRKLDNEEFKRQLQRDNEAFKRDLAAKRMGPCPIL